jgi:hypothetical protein
MVKKNVAPKKEEKETFPARKKRNAILYSEKNTKIQEARKRC